ncbi:MAG: RDD family protein [Planctomycetota bacterium]
MNAPDAAAGKALKCRQCGGRVPIPAAGSGGAATAKPRARRPVAESEEHGGGDGDDLFGGLDLRQMEDTKKKICPGCAAPVKDEDIDCPKCGVTIATGVLGERQRIRKERRGPPPEEFYRDVWGNAWKFLKKHWTFAVRTAVIWSLCLSMATTCAYSLRYYVTTRGAALLEMAQKDTTNIEIRGDRMYINVPKEKGSKVEFDRTFYQRSTVLWAPHVQPWREPPSIFWIFMTVAFQLGFGGWFWTLATTIANTTMSGEKRVKRFQFDFFANLTLGIRFYAWPTVLILPLLVIPGGVAFVSPVAAGIAAAVLLLFPILVLPAAVVHMAQKYSYRAWLLNWMAQDFARTIGASLYVFGMMFGLVLLIPGAIAGGIAAAQGQVVAWLLSQEAGALEWLKGNVMDMGEGNLRFLMYQMPLTFSASFVFFGLICTLIAFPAVFMMRVIGLYGVYFRADLSIVNEFPDLEVAGFGPRYLAFLVDLIVMTLLAGAGMFIGSMFGWLFGFYGWAIADQAGLGIGALASLILFGMYYTLGESGAARATLGKWSIGLIVLRDDDRPMSRDQALKRFFNSLVTVLTLFIGFIMCAFRPDRRATHDKMTKSKVVWQSEQT